MEKPKGQSGHRAGWSEASRRIGSQQARARFCMVILCLIAGALSGAGAQSNTAIVTGADHVFIRRGPGTEFPPFASLAEGAEVEVQEMRGEWARVLTASGQSGYVNSNFLALPGERPMRTPAAAVAAPTRPAPTRAAATPTTPTRSQAAVVQSLTEENKNLTARVQELQEELAALKAQAEAPTAVPTPVLTPAAPAADTDKLHDDLTQLRAAVEQLNKRLDVEPPHVNVSPLPHVPADGPVPAVTSTAILLTAVGLCLGWLVGNAFGRRQERGRRPRVRL